jgi:uncharacterized membrane protein
MSLQLPRHVHWLTRRSAIERLLASLVTGGLCWALAPAHFRVGTRLIAGWDGFALVALGLIWAMIFTADAGHIRRTATAQDPGRALTFGLTLLGAGASLLAVGLLLGGTRQVGPTERLVHLALSGVAVVTAWGVVHTLFTLRYAHEYFAEDRATAPSDRRGGLGFPGEAPASYRDFAYFAFIVGMTAQTADITVTTARMRALVLLHGLLAFAFNTAVLALTLNVVASQL